MPDLELAQVNIAILAAPLDSPQLAAFVDNLDPINALAESAPGFVWRLIGEGNDATSIVAFPDEQEGHGLILNMSVWTSIEALSAYVFGPEHAAIMRRRREFFVPMNRAYMAMWWVPAGARPTVHDAEERVQYLRANGPTPFAFTMTRPFPEPAGVPEQRVTETTPAG